MIVKDFKGYIEGLDITKIGQQHLSYPSRNVFVHKGKAFTRLGIKNDGEVSTADAPVHSEFVWKDALAGELPIRCTGRNVQMKWNGRWYTIFSSLSASVVRVRFATWVDGNGAIIKKRLFFVDGSDSVYEWSGGVATVASYANPNITISGTSNLNALGFDSGTVTPQTMVIVRLDVSGNVLTHEEKTHDDDCTDKIMHFTGALTNTPVAGDLVIAKPIAYTTLTGFTKDEIYNYKGHIVLWGFNNVQVYFSHISTFAIATGLDYTIPAPASRTALTAFSLNLDGKPTANIGRKDTLWLSTIDDWFKITKLNTVNAYDLFVEVEKVETIERTGALPYAVCKHKGDVIFMAQDQTLNRITTLEITGQTDIERLSDSVEDLFARLNMSEIRMYYSERYIYIFLPAESTLIMLDLIENYFQPPQSIPANCMSIIGGAKYAHSNARDETFYLFKGRNDLGAPIDAVFAFGYRSEDQEFRYKNSTIFGISGRMITSTKVTTQVMHETDGSKLVSTSIFKGNEVSYFDAGTDDSWATYPWGFRSWAGADMEATESKRFYAFDKLDAISWFESRVIITVSPINTDNTDIEFQLLAWTMDDSLSTRKIGDELFLTR
jgi:hypothetical protein